MAKKKAAGRSVDRTTSSATALVPVERIQSAILHVSGRTVMLDADLAELYGVETRILVRNVKRNIERFPDDFMSQLAADQWESLRSQIGISKTEGRGGRRTLPYVFTEQGVAMLSTVLRSPRAVQVNIEIMRAFVRLRQLLASNQALARQFAKFEKSTDARFLAVFKAIRMIAAESKETRALVEGAGAKRRQKPRIGFRPGAD